MRSSRSHVKAAGECFGSLSGYFRQMLIPETRHLEGTWELTTFTSIMPARFELEIHPRSTRLLGLSNH